jgi:hypothetical protein
MVCDELVIVHDGQVEAFNESLDDTFWLARREDGNCQQLWRNIPARETARRREIRQQEAQRRAQLKPLTDCGNPTRNDNHS